MKYTEYSVNLFVISDISFTSSSNVYFVFMSTALETEKYNWSAFFDI
jgi:hypothetical protein